LGNALRLAKVGYNPNDNTNLVKRSKTLFTAQLWPIAAIMDVGARPDIYRRLAARGVNLD